MANHQYETLDSWADVKAKLATVTSHQDLVLLNEAVEAAFVSDRQRLHMSDAEWLEYTALLAVKAAQLKT